MQPAASRLPSIRPFPGAVLCKLCHYLYQSGSDYCGMTAFRSRCLRAFQSGITSATTAWNAGE